ncbi:MAG TPA: glycosyltransferase [Arachidicoccus sp.]|nr:glycosyltransferase [Arachidicoccus sp.]
MKVLQIIPNISGGGAERFIVDLSNELLKEHSVSLVTLYKQNEDDIFRKDLSDGVTTYTVNKKLGVDLTIPFRLLKLIKKINPDVIHNHLRSVNYLLPIIPFLGKIPIVHTIHNDAFKECPNARLRGIRRLFFIRRKIIPVAISGESLESFLMAYGKVEPILIRNGRSLPLPSAQIETVYKEIESYKKDEQTRVIVNIGRLIPQKNQVMLVNAFKKLVKEFDVNATLIIIGGERNTIESEEIVRDLKIAEREMGNIHILGEKPNATDYLFAADYFCLPSIYEGMPITLIEAMAIGAIPICTAVGGIPEMISPLGDKLLFKEISANEMCNRLKTIILESDDWHQIIKESAKKRFLKEYGIEKCAYEYNALYHKLYIA